MRSWLYLGVLALGGCDALWSWRLVDCSGSRQGCPGADMSIAESTDLAGADLAGADLAGSPAQPDMALPPGFISLANRYYYNFITNNVLLGSSDNKFALYTYPNTSINTSYSVTNLFTTPIYGVAEIRVPGMLGGQPDRGFLAMTGDGRLFSRPDTTMATAFTQAGAAGKSLNALWMSTPDGTPNAASYGWAVGQAGTVVAINYSNGNPTIVTKQEAVANGANLLGLDAIDMMMVTTGIDMGTGAPMGQAWAVGTGGVIIEKVGTAWRLVGMTDFAGATPPTRTLYGVSRGSDGSVFAVGDSGSVVRRGLDTIWSGMATGASVTLYGIAVNNVNDAIAVGASGTILRLSGSGWAPESAAAFGAERPMGTLRAIKCYFSTECWVVGDGGALWRWNGSMWQKYLN